MPQRTLPLTRTFRTPVLVPDDDPNGSTERTVLRSSVPRLYIRHAVGNSLAGGRSDDETGFAMLVGLDQSGNLIEVGIVVTDDIEYAIHAMRARNRYLDWL